MDGETAERSPRQVILDLVRPYRRRLFVISLLALFGCHRGEGAPEGASKSGAAIKAKAPVVAFKVNLDASAPPTIV